MIAVTPLTCTLCISIPNKLLAAMLASPEHSTAACCQGRKPHNRPNITPELVAEGII
jgi:hypothetical protein